MIEFTAWPKTPRLFRDAIITEKIDGTNAGIHIVSLGAAFETDGTEPGIVVTVGDGEDASFYRVVAQSRKRLLEPGKLTDNFGFAGWVHEHAAALVVNLGTGLHYGEWWGSGIQRAYGLTDGEKRFSLFHVHKYRAMGLDVVRHATDTRPVVPGLGVVPLLDQHTFSTERVEQIKQQLVEHGSYAAPGFDNPEGIIVYHTASKTTFKSLIENDDSPKGE